VDAKTPVDISAYTTVTVTLACNTQTSNLRAKIDFDDSTNYCAPIMCGSNPLDLKTSFLDECWEGGAQTELDPTLLTSVAGIQIGVYTSKGSTTPFDFCVTEISFL
jgi:hypothetical protein